MRMFLFMFWLLTHGGKMYVTPQVCFAPCSVEVRVSPPEEGDSLRIEADSGDYYTADFRPKPSSTRVYTLKNLPEGSYTVKATVYDHQRAVWAEEKHLEVAGSVDLLHDQS